MIIIIMMMMMMIIIIIINFVQHRKSEVDGLARFTKNYNIKSICTKTDK